ncbi:MAG: DUF4279 domain-containing protein [Planctomycetaceae bacterium]
MDVDYPSADGTFAAIHFEADHIDVDEMNSLFGREHCIFHNKGDLLDDTSGFFWKCDYDTWQLKSEPAVDSLDLRHHVDWLEAQITPRLSKLREIANRPSARKLVVRCYWWSTEGHGGPALWPKQLLWLSQSNLPCEFRFYFSTDGRNDFRVSMKAKN